MIAAHITDKTEASAVAVEVVAGAAASQKGVEIPTTSLVILDLVHNGKINFLGLLPHKSQPWQSQQPPAHAWNQQQPIPSTWASQPPCPYPTAAQFTPARSTTPGLLGPRPTAQPHQAYTASEAQYTPTEIDQTFATMSLNQQDPNWYVDSGAMSHMTNNPRNYSSYVNNGNFRNIIVGDGAKIAIQGTGNQTLSHPFPPFSLNNVLYVPTIVKILLSVRKLTTDNNLSIEFDPYGFTLKDFQTRTPLLRCNSVGDLYPLTINSTTQVTSPSTFVAVTQDLWHSRLGHPGSNIFQVFSTFLTFYNLIKTQFSKSIKNIQCDNGREYDNDAFRQFSNNHDWKRTMDDEFRALIDNKTWVLVPRHSGMNIVRSMWVFRYKTKSDGTLERYKARLVCDGRSQQVGIDCGDTFSPVVKPATIRTVLTLAISQRWPIHQLDVKNAFLHGTLHETVYMHQPVGFRHPTFPDHVCLLKWSLYGLKQAPRAWYERFATYVTKIGFTHSKFDHSLFIYHRGPDTAYILLYVDDIVLVTSSDSLRHKVMTLLASEFAMKDLGPLSFFLGIAVIRSSSDSLFLSQHKYALEVLQRAGLALCNPAPTPVDTNSKLSSNDGTLLDNPTEYRQLVGALPYLTIARPDISYAVQQVCMHMHAPRTSYMNALKRILRYVRGTITYGLTFHSSSTNSLVAYTDADWAECPDTRRSTSGYCIYLGDNLLSWSSKRQPTISRSSAEAEYRAVANVVSETCRLRNLLCDLFHPPSKATLVYYDNVSAMYLSTNPVQHQRTKHIEIDIHFVREKVARGQVRPLHVPSRYQIADTFTKGLPRILFDDFQSSLNVREPPVSTAGV
ncbi:hypothetical protein OSB04_023612 [Centaurea solstitialis]|uniref:Uncharacterized protein n=1 Tax=Centaurea solstitialis TaxID=347529 RepID=A0AA38W9L3_9ASTR|nr:hypothetical protein OSB04_023612 [Centaurea solstitialis]